MKTLLFAALLALPLCAFAEDAAPGPDVLPGLEEMKPEAAADKPALQRPDSQKIMSEISEALHLSSKQEDRISKAVSQKTREFDKNMDEYEKNSSEEKKWRYKMNENSRAMEKITRDMPDVVRDYLDDEQRQSYDNLLAAKNKPAAAAEPAPAPAAKDEGAKPGKKRKLVRRKKAGAAPAAGQAGAAAPEAEEAGAAAGAAEDTGGVMVDKDTSGAPPKRKLVRRKKRTAPKAAPAPEINEKEPAGAAPTGKEAPAPDEDAGSYP